MSPLVMQDPLSLFIFLLMSWNFLGNDYFGFRSLFIPFPEVCHEFLGGEREDERNERHQAILRILPSSNPGSLPLYNNAKIHAVLLRNQSIILLN